MVGGLEISFLLSRRVGAFFMRTQVFLCSSILPRYLVCERMGVCRKPHAVLVPYPAQGHINPMMQLARKLVSEGFLITFVNTDFNHERIIQSNKKMRSDVPPGEGLDTIRLVSIPDGLPPDDARTNFAKLDQSMENSMAPLLLNLIHQINQSEDHKVTCLIADVHVSGWALDVAKHFRIPTAALWTMLIADYAIFYNIPSLVSSGILPSNGVPKEHKMVQYLPGIPPLHSSHLGWMVGSEGDREFIFNYTVRNMERVKDTEWVLCNSFHELEAPIINTFPKEASICPVGPLIPDHILQGNPEKTNGVSAGLWTGTNGTAAVFPSGFTERIRGRGCLVSWAPQLSVLSHSSVACFLTDCGWNSTLESIAMGVPMICWPYFVDQFMNRSYIVDVWKIGLALNANRDGLIGKGEIEEVVHRILAKEEGVEIGKRVLKLEQTAREAVKEGGSSSVSYNLFVKAMKSSKLS